MTGRDLIKYILDNHLEDEPIFKDGKFAGFMTIEEAAIKFEVGAATVQTWILFNLIDYVEFGMLRYIPYNAKHPYGGKEEQCESC